MQTTSVDETSTLTSREYLAKLHKDYALYTLAEKSLNTEERYHLEIEHYLNHKVAILNHLVKSDLVLFLIFINKKISLTEENFHKYNNFHVTYKHELHLYKLSEMKISIEQEILSRREN